MVNLNGDSRIHHFSAMEAGFSESCIILGVKFDKGDWLRESRLIGTNRGERAVRSEEVEKSLICISGWKVFNESCLGLWSGRDIGRVGGRKWG